MRWIRGRRRIAPGPVRLKIGSTLVVATPVEDTEVIDAGRYGMSLIGSPATSQERRGRMPLASVRDGDLRLEFRTVHGYRRAFLRAGQGPVVLLVHGIGDSSQTWRELIPLLARKHTVIAPDLLGHGQSDKPRADYSVAAFANGLRDLLEVLEIERATVVAVPLEPRATERVLEVVLKLSPAP